MTARPAATSIVEPRAIISPDDESRHAYHLRRLTSAFLKSEILPATLRTRVMRWLGYRLAPNVCIWSGCMLLSKNIEVAADVFINIGFYFDGVDHLYIGEKVRIGPFVRVVTGTHEIGPSSHRCSRSVVSAPVRIESGCWIGAVVTILPGVTIRQGCVINAGALVMESTEPDGIYAGMPARRIRDLEPEGQI